MKIKVMGTGDIAPFPEVALKPKMKWWTYKTPELKRTQSRLGLSSTRVSGDERK